MLAEALTPGKGQDDPVLEELDLCNNSIGAEGATAVASVLTSNKTLKKINLFWNNIGNEGLQAICANLRKDFPLDFVLVSSARVALKFLFMIRPHFMHSSKLRRLFKI